MNKLPLISVVIPIFNGESYLQDIFSNFEKQTYQNYEVVLVNDLSTDNTLEVLNEYAKTNPKFIICNRTTKGGTAVAGLEYALPYCSGDYFFFMSHDDFFDDDFLEKCLNTALETDADSVIPNLILYYGEGKEKKHDNYPLNNDYTSVLDSKEAFLLSLEWNISGNAFRKMKLVREVGYKAEYYNSCEFFGRIMTLKSNKNVFCNTNFYYRQNNAGAITKQFHYFHVDILTTDIMLFRYMINLEPRSERTRKRLKHIVKYYFCWIKDYLATPMTRTEKKYVLRSLMKATGDIVCLWFEVYIKK